MADLTKEQKRDYAKTLYLTERGISQKEISERAGVTEATISTWIKKYSWDTLRVSLLTIKEERLARLYQQLAESDNIINQREEGRRVATSREADVYVKLTTSIKNLETELSVGEMMSTGRRFLTYARRVGDLEQSKAIGKLFDAFIKSSMK